MQSAYFGWKRSSIDHWSSSQNKRVLNPRTKFGYFRDKFLGQMVQLRFILMVLNYSIGAKLMLITRNNYAFIVAVGNFGLA